MILTLECLLTLRRVHTGVRRYLEFSATDIWEGKKIVVWKTADYTPTIVIGSIYDIFNDNYEQWNMDLNELIMPLIFRQCLSFSQTFNICLKKKQGGFYTSFINICYL